MRPRQIITLGAIVLLCFLFYTLLQLGAPQRPKLIPDLTSTKPRPLAADPVQEQDDSSSTIAEGNAPTRSKPKPAPGGSHPMWHLIRDAEAKLEEEKTRQSKTLGEAVTEYRRRYGIPPPPNFDKWYQFATSKGVQLIDEFDTIHELMTPFWGLKPSTIRSRAAEALGFGNSLLGVQIRNGRMTNIQGGGDWQRDATEGMMKPFIEHLPSMDLCFNIHDEPRVIVPHDDMERLVDLAKNKNMKAANSVSHPRNEFTKKPKGINEGTYFTETKLTRFNVFAHQATWTHSRMSCPPESPARALEESEQSDDLARYGMGELGFVYNATAMSDICYSPSLSSTYGFFERPNAYDIVHDLFPIFSQSKISSYNDIIYPSPWYWADKVPYEEEKDYSWDTKKDQLYWRGSTTGGFSRNGGWRRQHRQRFVQKINAADQAKVLVNRGDDSHPSWEAKEVPRGDYKDIINVQFSHVGQCDQGDCDAQVEFFQVGSRVEQQDAWQYKYLLDIDGNAFSGRFYAFLKSRSLVYKFSIFREWHYEWVKAWAHYIPLSLHGDEWLEAVRFFGDGDLGKKEAERLALQGRHWADKVLRKEDMEVWFFRLLLEYGRVIDDDRENIGFSVGSPPVTG
ncbi:hypothetical protein VSDG_03841 [Cytospora chrysosperma]|uniref:Glycosyl transferase CAP10 domain-containing protein n=1 Tax=Cytospora chrysosperma TaxID=252740 RepID=A0A423W6G0_CYTCH|nr:hypothetical protein VSDG_03841 [Valsa sordida]